MFVSPGSLSTAPHTESSMIWTGSALLDQEYIWAKRIYSETDQKLMVYVALLEKKNKPVQLNFQEFELK